MRCADCEAARTRRYSVRMPRSNSQASNEPSVPPICARTVLTRRQNSLSSRVTSAPATRSEWPLRYLVPACMTMSAPSVSGRVSTGEATVESTATRAPAACAISAVAAMSVTVHSGLAGVSIHTSLVAPGRTEACTAAGSVMSISSTFKPQRVAKFISQLRSDQYMTLGASTWSPGDRAWNTAVAAAMPEANSAACAPSSNCASTASAWSKAGLSARA